MGLQSQSQEVQGQPGTTMFPVQYPAPPGFFELRPMHTPVLGDEVTTFLVVTSSPEIGVCEGPKTPMKPLTTTPDEQLGPLHGCLKIICVFERVEVTHIIKRCRNADRFIIMSLSSLIMVLD